MGEVELTRQEAVLVAWRMTVGDEKYGLEAWTGRTRCSDKVRQSARSWLRFPLLRVCVQFRFGSIHSCPSFRSLFCSVVGCSLAVSSSCLSPSDTCSQRHRCTTNTVTSSQSHLSCARLSFEVRR